MVTGSLIGRKNLPTTAPLQSVVSGISDVSISVSFIFFRATISLFRFLLALCIDLSFPRCSFASRDDADDFFIALKFNGVRDKEHYHAFDQSQCLPALFALDKTVLNTNCMRIIENRDCCFEANLMLQEVATIFPSSQMKRISWYLQYSTYVVPWIANCPRACGFQGVGRCGPE